MSCFNLANLHRNRLCSEVINQTWDMDSKEYQGSHMSFRTWHLHQPLQRLQARYSTLSLPKGCNFDCRQVGNALTHAMYYYVVEGVQKSLSNFKILVTPTGLVLVLYTSHNTSHARRVGAGHMARDKVIRPGVFECITSD